MAALIYGGPSPITTSVTTFCFPFNRPISPKITPDWAGSPKVFVTSFADRMSFL